MWNKRETIPALLMSTFLCVLFSCVDEPTFTQQIQTDMIYYLKINSELWQTKKSNLLKQKKREHTQFTNDLLKLKLYMDKNIINIRPVTYYFRNRFKKLLWVRGHTARTLYSQFSSVITQSYSICVVLIHNSETKHQGPVNFAVNEWNKSWL
jgi:hypothetical protein